MKDKKRRIELFSFYDHTNIEKHLEKMAAKGWMIEKIGNTFWHYKKIKPQKLSYSIVYFPKKVDEGIIVSEDRQNFIDMCTSVGWNYVINKDQMHIFCSKDENTTPIETDAQIQIECIHKFAKREIIYNYIATILLIIASFAFTGYQIWKEPVDTLTEWNPFWIYLYPFLIPFFLYNIIEYLLWHKKAKAAAKQGEFCETKRLIKIEALCFFPIFSFSILLEFIFHLRSQYILYLIGLVVAAVILIYLFRFIQKSYSNSKSRRTINTAIGFFLLAGYVAGAIAVFLALPKPYEKVKIEIPYAYGTETHTQTYYVYHDEGAPLNLEEFIQTDKRISKERFDKNVILVEQETWTQFTDEEDSVTLRYVITDVHFDSLYERCKNELITENKIYDFTETQVKDLSGYETYQSSGLDSFVFCRDGRIVQIDFDWEPTDEQIAIAAEKLMNANI